MTSNSKLDCHAFKPKLYSDPLYFSMKPIVRGHPERVFWQVPNQNRYWLIVSTRPITVQLNSSLMPANKPLMVSFDATQFSVMKSSERGIFVNISCSDHDHHHHFNCWIGARFVWMARILTSIICMKMLAEPPPALILTIDFYEGLLLMFGGSKTKKILKNAAKVRPPNPKKNKLSLVWKLN